MKTTVAAVLLMSCLGLIVGRLEAATLAVEKMCDANSLIARADTLQAVGSTVLDWTIAELEKSGEEFVSTGLQLVSVIGSPYGPEAIESLGGNDIRAYGWCFFVDGVLSEKPAFQVLVDEQTVVRWYFGYAEYLGGQWVNFCEPVASLQPAHICGQIKSGPSH